jgi:hypothetical protein
MTDRRPTQEFFYIMIKGILLFLSLTFKMPTKN